MKIAVVGIACRYPGASSAVELYENILAGRRYFREMPPERWALEDYYDPDRNKPDRTYCKHAALIDGFDFNPSAFRIPQSTYRATDVAQWLALAVAKEALENADIIDPPRVHTAVILGNTLAGETSRAHLVRYRWPYARRVFAELLDNLDIGGDERAYVLSLVEERYKRPFPPVNEDNLAGGLANTIAGRICNHFDFQGGGYTVDGACSSSLLAIQEACIGLEQHLCDLVLAGGIDISLDPFELVGFAKVGALTDSDIRVYDQRASGFLPGEGCGIVVLKRLEDAVRDGNRIYAIVRGVGYSSDGRGGITAPSVLGQSLAVDRAYHMAGYSFADVELIEGHGTGTPVGDRVELRTFIEAKVRHGAETRHRCGIGSIKSIIGHTKAAAGVAGFIKAVLSVYYQVQPPTMGITAPNELFATTRHLHPLVRGRLWKSEGRCRAAVSSAGFGGINTHITVERHDDSDTGASRSINAEYLMQSYQNAELFILSAESAADLEAKVAELSPVARQLCHAELVDLAAYCAQSASARALRLAVVADSPYALHEKLERVRAHLASRSGGSGDPDWVDVAAGIFLRRTRRAPRVAFLFPGQGSQYLDMSRRWRDRYPFVRAHWRGCDDALEDLLSHPLSEDVFHDDLWAESQQWNTWSRNLRATNIAQPAIVAASMATAEVLQYFGVEPDLVIGHSLGEYTALWSAGVVSKTDALRLAAFRGAAMHAAADTGGGMLSINEAPRAVEALCDGIAGYLAIANFNAPEQTVVSGELAAIEALEARCRVRAISATRLDVAGAFHSKLMAPAQDLMSDALRGARFDAPKRLMISTVTGDVIGKNHDFPEHLSRQIVSPVRFSAAVQAAVREHADVFIEVGPGSALCGLARRILGDSGPPAFTTDGGMQTDWSGWLQAMGYLYVGGLPIVPQRLFENRFFRPFRLPYRPRFIASPCESPVEPLILETKVGGRRAPDAPARPRPASEPRARTGEAPEKAEGECTAEELFALMQRFIHQRFGYPRELVQPATLLTDDLNLDSIKSAEVIAEAMDRVRVRADLPSFYRLSLGEIAGRLVDLYRKQAREGGGASGPAEEARPAWVRVFETGLVPESLGESRRVLTAGCVLLAAEPGDPLIDRLEEQLASCGFTVERHVGGASAAHHGGALRGCIVLVPPDEGTDIEDLDAAELERRLLALPNRLLEVANAFHGRLEAKPTDAPEFASTGPPFFALILRSGTLLGRGWVPHRWEGAPACAAFMKSWSSENPNIETRVLDFEHDAGADVVCDLLLDELECGSGFVEAAYTITGQRMVPQLKPLSPGALAPSPSAFDEPDEVMLVTGGAKGITAECVKALCAAGRRVKLALVGSAPAPSAADMDNEISRTLEALGRQQLVARYYQCDVTDPAAVAACVERVTRELGTISAAIHGAGINIPHRIDGLDVEAFDAVLRPKLLGLVNLVRTLDLEKLRELTLFSSIIGVSGMAGNADYAYANAWASLLMGRVCAMHPHIQCRAFAFSIWQDVGMGARLGSVSALKRQGIEAIPREEGVRRFVELMRLKWPGVELVVMAQSKGLPTLRFADPAHPATRFLENVLSYQPGVDCVAEVLLHPQRDGYLADHNYNGTLLFPAVMGMEAMAQVALKCARVHLEDAIAPALENLHFDRPIAVPAQGRRVRIYARADERASDGLLRVRVEIRSELTGYDVASFSAECVWRKEPRPMPRGNPPLWPDPLPVDPRRQLYGPLLFQGPRFQTVISLHDVSARHCLVRIRLAAREGDADAAELIGPVLGSAAARDGYLHSIQVCVPQYRILPVGIESLETRANGSEYGYLVANERERTDREFVYDVEVLDPSGELIEKIRGYRCKIVDTFEDRQTLALLARIHEQAACLEGP